MVALATVEDLEERLQRTLDGVEAVAAQAALDDVSATVRAYTGQAFTLETSTVRVQARGPGIRLPQRPVVDVTDVSTVDGTPVVFRWDYGEVVDVAGLSATYSFEVVPFSTRHPYLDITYEHGYDSIPGDVVAVVCQIAGRAFGQTADRSGVTQESIGGYSYSIGSAAAAGPAGMLADERRVLDLYRRPVGVIHVASR